MKRQIVSSETRPAFHRITLEFNDDTLVGGILRAFNGNQNMRVNHSIVELVDKRALNSGRKKKQHTDAFPSPSRIKVMKLSTLVELAERIRDDHEIEFDEDTDDKKAVEKWVLHAIQKVKTRWARDANAEVKWPSPSAVKVQGYKALDKLAVKIAARLDVDTPDFGFDKVETLRKWVLKNLPKAKEMN